MKKFLTIFILFFSLFILTGCDKDKPVIIFSSSPFSKEHGYTEQGQYNKGQKVYYLIYNPEGFKTRLIKVQAFRKDYDNADEHFGYEYLYNKTIELEDKKLYTDYFIFNKKGYYIFQVFDYINTIKPVVKGIIKVVD